MNKLQKTKMNMFIAVSLFFVKNALTFATYIELVNQISGFSTSLNDLNVIFRNKVNTSGE